MILAENRVPFGSIFVPEEEFENNESSLWFAAVQLRYYLSRITIAPFEIEKATDSNKKGLYLSKTNKYDEDGFKISTTDNDQILISGGICGIMYCQSENRPLIDLFYADVRIKIPIFSWQTQKKGVKSFIYFREETEIMLTSRNYYFYYFNQDCLTSFKKAN